MASVSTLLDPGTSVSSGGSVASSMPGGGSRRSPSHSCSKVWECRALRLEAGSPLEWGQKWGGGWTTGGLTAKPDRCFPGAETCRAPRRSTWAPHPSGGEAWGPAEKLGVIAGRRTPLLLHPLSPCPDLAYPGARTWVSGRERSESPACCAHTPLRDWARDGKGSLLFLLHWDCPPLGSRSGLSRHGVSVGRGNTPASHAY